MDYFGIFIPFVALSIPIVAIVLSYKQKAQRNKTKELELQKEILQLEIEKQNGTIRLLEEENKKLDTQYRESTIENEKVYKETIERYENLTNDQQDKLTRYEKLTNDFQTTIGI